MMLANNGAVHLEILGTNYVIREGDPGAGRDGYCDRFTREIVVSPKGELFREDRDANDLQREAAYREVLRHEIIHAFFAEAGMAAWLEDEALVSFIAIQFPKMESAFKLMDCGR